MQLSCLLASVSAGRQIVQLSGADSYSRAHHEVAVSVVNRTIAVWLHLGAGVWWLWAARQPERGAAVPRGGD